MKRFLLLLLAAAALPAADSVHEFTLNSIEGVPTPLANYRGKAVLFVNVASRCGYTPQYKGLESLYRKYGSRGLVVVGVPANNFGSEEPGSNREIQDFCKRTFDITFPMMAKISVSGDDMAPLYRHLTAQTGREITWNFTKILVDRSGKVVARFDPNTDPEDPQLQAAIEKALR